MATRNLAGTTGFATTCNIPDHASAVRGFRSVAGRTRRTETSAEAGKRMWHPQP